MTKYRGFRKDGKGWVEGYYSFRFNSHRIQTIDENDLNGDASLIHEIHPESLGMATPFTDKNGKTIFEGDNLKDDDGGFIYNNVKLGEVTLGIDEFNVKYAATCFYAQCNDLSGYFALSQVDSKDKYGIGTGQCEIIGNQYEPPQPFNPLQHEQSK